MSMLKKKSGCAAKLNERVYLCYSFHQTVYATGASFVLQGKLLLSSLQTSQKHFNTQMLLRKITTQNEILTKIL